MTKAETPPWLKRMDNGAIGEARTKAFLMDRFWILERSVDIDGADFIIQRKIRSSNLLDPSPPRFGVVQVKFFSDSSTTQYIHKEYLIDKTGAPRKEFFVACHTGSESGATFYLLAAKDVIESFDTAKEGQVQEGKFVIPGRVLLVSDKFKVTSSKLALDRIERAIEQANFQNNRFFISWALPSVESDLKRIDPIFLEPIENWWGDIPTGFREMKEKARSALWEIEEVYDDYKKIIESVDPEEALTVARDLQRSLGCYGGVRLSLPDDLYDDDFMSAVKEHKKKYEELKGAGLLDHFILLHQRIIKVVAETIGPAMPVQPDDVYVIRVLYHSITLTDAHIEVVSVKEGELSLPIEVSTFPEPVTRPKSSDLFESEPGNIQAYVIPSRYGYRRKETTPWLEYFLTDPPYIISTVMDKVYEMLFRAE